MKTDNYNKLIDVFSFLHDGLIEKILFENNSMKLNVNIDSYTQFIDKDFKYLYVSIDNISDLEYMDWTENSERYIELNIIQAFAQDLWIVRTELSKDGRIEINCHGGKSTDENSSGASIYFNFTDYSIKDENDNYITLTDLERLNKMFVDQINKTNAQHTI